MSSKIVRLHNREGVKIKLINYFVVCLKDGQTILDQGTDHVDEQTDHFNG